MAVKTAKQKKLAAMYGDKNKITRGDIITAAKKKAGKAKGLKAEKGKTVLGDRFKKLQQQTAMKIVKPKKTRRRGK